MPISSQPTTPPQSPDQAWEADAIVVERLHLDDNNPDDHAKTELRKACDDLVLDEVDRFIYGNQEGFCVLEEQAQLRRELRIAEGKNKKNVDLYKHKSDRNKEEIDFLQNEITRLRVEVQGGWLVEEALNIRRRFIDHFKRDVLKLEEFRGTDAIKAGNNTAYHGNALSDAYIFKHDNRMDFTTYSHLYGLQFTQVLNYFYNSIDGGIFSVLNAYATLLVQSPLEKEISPELEQAFRSFTTSAENFYPLTPMDDDKSKLAKAYWEIWRLYKQYKNQLSIM